MIPLVKFYGDKISCYNYKKNLQYNMEIDVFY